MRASGFPPRRLEWRTWSRPPRWRMRSPSTGAFIDEMVPHHQGAIRIARVVLEETEDDETRSLAEAIVRTQSDEIEQLNHWRRAWYGDVSPAGGAPEDAVPNETDSMEEHEGH